MASQTSAPTPILSLERKSFGLLGALGSLLLLLHAHSPESSNFWAYIALVPLLTIHAVHSFTSLSLFAAISSLGQSIWMFESIFATATLPALAATLLHSIQVILPTLIFKLMARRYGYGLAVPGFVGTWMLWEELRALPTLNGTLTSFYSIAYTQAPAPPMIASGFDGQHLVVLAILTFNVAVACALSRPIVFRVVAVAAAAWIFAQGFVRADNSSGSNDRVLFTAIQPGQTPLEHEIASMDTQASIEFTRQLATMILANNNSHMYLLPETILRGPVFLAELTHLLANANATVISGGINDSNQHSYNSVLEIVPPNYTAIYSKWLLVPLVESNRFSPGTFVTTVEAPNGRLIGIAVCMDGTSSWLLRHTVAAGADMIVVLSASDYGYGYQTPALHLHLVRHQAARLQVPILFLATNGPSAFISETGRIISSLQEGMQGVIHSSSWEP